MIGSFKDQNVTQNQQSNTVDEEDFISKLVAPMQAKSKAELIGNQKSQNRSQKNLDAEFGDTTNIDGYPVEAVVNADHL